MASQGQDVGEKSEGDEPAPTSGEGLTEVCLEAVGRCREGLASCRGMEGAAEAGSRSCHFLCFLDGRACGQPAQQTGESVCVRLDTKSGSCSYSSVAVWGEIEFSVRNGSPDYRRQPSSS